MCLLVGALLGTGWGHGALGAGAAGYPEEQLKAKWCVGWGCPGVLCEGSPVTATQTELVASWGCSWRLSSGRFWHPEWKLVQVGMFLGSLFRAHTEGDSLDRARGLVFCGASPWGCLRGQQEPAQTVQGVLAGSVQGLLGIGL